MKVTICGDFNFYDKIQEVKRRLENLNIEVILPPWEAMDENGTMISAAEYFNLKMSDIGQKNLVRGGVIKKRFDGIIWGDALLILNYDKNGIANYLGGNSLVEMAVAYYLNKPIYLFNPAPEISYKEEILGMFPIVLNGDLTKI